MAFPASLVVVFVGLIFIFSGVIVNFIQAVVYVFIRPVSRSLYRRINKVVAELLWSELVWLVDWWSNLEVRWYGDDETFEQMGKEHAILISNHRSDIDWLLGWVLAEKSGCLGSALAVMKKEAKVLPIVGWSMWFSGYLFLDRSWAKDEKRLQKGYKWLEDFPMPFWLAIFVEGTRFTQAKLEAAQDFAASRGLPIPRNVLLPRTKGFVSAITNMRKFVPAIYDCTLAVPRNQPQPKVLRLFRRQPCVVHIQVNRHPMNELPETPDAIAQWCKDLFITKDAILEKFHTTDNFSDKKIRELARPKKSLIVVMFWSIAMVCGMVWLFERLATHGSWQVIAFSVTILGLVFVVMQILIHSSESERSTPRPAPKSSDDPMRVGLLQSSPDDVDQTDQSERSSPRAHV